MVILVLRIQSIDGWNHVCDNSRLLSINNTCQFCFTEAVTYCSKWLSMQGPACSPRVHFSSIPNLKGPSSIQPATIATRPWPWVRQPHRSPPAAHKPEVLARASARYVWEWGPLLYWSVGSKGTVLEQSCEKATGPLLPFCGMPHDFLKMPLVLWVKETNNKIPLWNNTEL